MNAVNVASRMESSGAPGFIHLTEATLLASGLPESAPCLTKQVINVKGVGEVTSYLLNPATLDAATCALIGVDPVKPSEAAAYSDGEGLATAMDLLASVSDARVDAPSRRHQMTAVANRSVSSFLSGGGGNGNDTTKDFTASIKPKAFPRLSAVN